MASRSSTTCPTAALPVQPFADYLGYYEEAGLTAEGFKGSSYTEALGTNQAQVAVGHIATMLVPATNDVDLTFVGGAHIGCNPCTFWLTAIQHTEDLKGTSISVPNGIGASDYNITCLLLDADGINPQTDVNLMQVSTDACVASMENGEISAALLSDTFAYSLVQEGKLKCIRSLLDEDFADEPCCVIAMNATFVKENPTIAKKVVQCVQKAHQWMRENPEEASQVLIDEGMNSGDLEMNTMLNNSLQFGLDEDFTSTSLRTVVEKYIRPWSDHRHRRCRRGYGKGLDTGSGRIKLTTNIKRYIPNQQKAPSLNGKGLSRLFFLFTQKAKADRRCKIY